MEEYKVIAVIDLSNTSLHIYDINPKWDNERIENFLEQQGHHLSNCSWGEFDGIIIDHRE